MRLALPVLALGLLACAGTEVAKEEPARLLDPSAEARAELRSVVAAAVGQADILLAEDALTTTDVLSLEPAARAARPELRLPPEAETGTLHFRLLLQEGRCVLLAPDSGRRWTLQKARCEAL